MMFAVTAILCSVFRTTPALVISPSAPQLIREIAFDLRFLHSDYGDILLFAERSGFNEEVDEL